MTVKLHCCPKLLADITHGREVSDLRRSTMTVKSDGMVRVDHVFFQRPSSGGNSDTRVSVPRYQTPHTQADRGIDTRRESEGGGREREKSRSSKKEGMEGRRREREM